MQANDATETGHRDRFCVPAKAAKVIPFTAA